MQTQYDHDRNDCNPATMRPEQYGQNEGTDMMWNATDVLPDVAELDRVANPSTFATNGRYTNDNDTSNDTRITRASLDKQSRDPTAELLRLHYKFGHVSFDTRTYTDTQSPCSRTCIVGFIDLFALVWVGFLLALPYRHAGHIGNGHVAISLGRAPFFAIARKRLSKFIVQPEQFCCGVPTLFV
jgi:hypothetical protein